MQTRRLGFFCALAAIELILVSAALCSDVTVRKVEGTFPKASLEPIASGSGVVIGPRLVLTNRHVATSDSDQPRSGFRIRLGPEYKSGPNARVLWVCESHDLAILETASDLQAGELLILNAVPPLGTKLTAYGFPLGDEFGIGLTATGGQITRQPVKDQQGGKDSDIKESLWHDAVTSGGSSGGPLFSEQGVLVGLHFASLATKHGLAIPAAIVAEFVRKTGAGQRVKFIEPEGLSAAKATYDPKTVTVFVEVLGDGAAEERPVLASSEFGRIKQAVEAIIREQIPHLTGNELSELWSGEIKSAFTHASSAAQIRKGEVVRLKGKATIIQIIDEGFLARIDGVLCLIVVPGLDSKVARAKLGNDVTDVPVDSVFAVGEATDYKTVQGLTNSYFPLLRVDGVIEPARLAEMVDAERKKREVVERAEREKRQIAEKMEEERRRSAAVAVAIKQLQHMFKDTVGKFTVDAVMVKVDGHEQKVELIRVSDKKRIDVPIKRLSDADRRWIAANAKFSREHGLEVAKELLSPLPKVADATPAPATLANPTAALANTTATPTPATVSPQPATIESPKRVGSVLYLADVTEAAVEVLQYGGKPLLSKGEIEDGGRMKTISLAGQKLPKGIFAHPKSNGKSRVAYDTKDREYKFFEASVGVDDSKNAAGDSAKSYQFSPLTFEVWGDGKMLWRSRPVTPGSEPQKCRVALPQVSQLELIVQCPGSDGTAWAVWGDPRLVSGE
jgi:V8-like Glu-specific endopeptidase